VTLNTTPAARPAIDRACFLQPSPYEADGGHSIGKDPREIALAEIRHLQHPESPIKAIRAKCVDCCGGNAAEARKCTAVFCPLWPMRMGVSPFHAASASSKREMANFAPSSSGEAF
jgi:hypothetical protein